MEKFFAMGGYAAYVWPAYIASFAGIVGLVWTTLRGYARTKAKLASLEDDVRDAR